MTQFGSKLARADPNVVTDQFEHFFRLPTHVPGIVKLPTDEIIGELLGDKSLELLISIWELW